ncbi:MAG TPA: S53 family peptidase [Solirubrobacteraceae bacterium]|jgi:hypothetical protein|nr:S53 family peptidase [Solirubrobacteraceae bacterium]
MALLAFALACADASAATIAPLPESDYGVRALCSQAGAGRAGCMSLELVPLSAAARAHTHPLAMLRSALASSPSPAAGSYGLRPSDIHTAYQLPASAPSAQTVAIVDAYNDPNAESDLAAYSQEFGLPACTTANGCFSQVNEAGATAPLPYPHSGAELESGLAGTGGERLEAEEAAGWGVEISLDMEAVHAMCESCHILLVEAASSSFEDLEAAERTADRSGATEISNSFGGPEDETTAQLELESAFNHPGAVVTASAGDAGYLAWDAESSWERGFAAFPASSPHVVAVGGTRLNVGVGGTWLGETVWNGKGAGGGGCSVVFAAPSWQQALPNWSSIGCNGRAVADISADADPYTGLAVHDTSPDCRTKYEVIHTVNWCTVGGTSLSSPLIAGAFALAGGAGSAPYPARTLYEAVQARPGSVHDVTSGSNGECGLPYNPNTGLSSCTTAAEAASCASDGICLAGPGYDGPSGLGTPDGLAAFQAVTPSAPAVESGSSNKSSTQAPPAAPAAPVAPAPAVTPAPAPSLSGLELTVAAIVALNRPRARIAAVSFAFSSNTIVSVRATLARRVRRHRRLMWATVGAATTLLALPGRDAGRFTGRHMLRRGSYRLLLTPARGAARSIEFKLG